MATASQARADASPQGATVRAFFKEQLPAHLNSAKAPPVMGLFVFDVTGEGGGRWTLDFRGTPAACRVGPAEGADCTITLTDEDLAAVLRRKADLEELFYAQRVQVEGDLNRAAGLLQLFTDATTPAAGLATLLAPYSADEFLTRYWPNEPLLLPPSLERLNALESMVPVSDVETLLANWRGTVRVFPPGEHDQLSPHVSPEAAATLYERGLTLVFDAVDLWYPDLYAWRESLQADLGLPPLVWGRCLVYATPAGAGFRPHFDENANFAIQLRGAKRWRIAPNASVVNPTFGYRVGGHLHPELLAEAQAALPERMPEAGLFEVTLEPGALLFLPRSYWHHTTALEPSLSLNFTFDQPCWADLLTRVLRWRLIQRPEWRELAADVDTPGERGARAAARARVLLADLAAETGRVDGDRLIDGVPLAAPRPELLDLKRDWVAALTQVGVAPPPAPAAPPAPGRTTAAGMMLYERLLLGWENPAALAGVCQFQLDGPDGGEFYLEITPHRLTYHEGRADEPTAFVRMPEDIARDLALGENVDFHDPVNLERIEAAGDDAILGMLAQMTKVPNRSAGARFAYAEARAALLPRTTEPRRLTRPTAAEVIEAIEEGAPLVLRDALPGWEEALGWTYESMRSRYGHVTVKSTLGVSTLGEFLDALAAADPAQPPPYTLGSVIPAELAGYFPPPFFDPDSFGPAQLWMGSGPQQISTMLHRDSGDAFLGQLIGRKRFKLYSPDQTPFMYVFKSYNRDQPCWVNPWEPDLDRFPLFHHAVATEFVLEPGELLIIPRGWYHTVLALDRTLSVGFHREPVTDFGRSLGRG
jgi:50S ribosomal protein L16 3-hydroxylase